MASFARHLASVVVLLSFAGCSEIFGGHDFADVSVTTDIDSDGLIGFTVKNDGGEAVFLHDTCWDWGWTAGVEQRTSKGAWEATNPIKPSRRVKVYCALAIFPPQAIEPGDEYTMSGSPADDWLTGEYRFRLGLQDEDGDPLPDEARTSNSFQIEE